MNEFRFRNHKGRKRASLEILVDGIPLAHHFSRPSGATPTLISPFGWEMAESSYWESVVSEFLGKQPSDLPSGRVPVLVCEECGDIGCGGFSVHIVRAGNVIKWSDWKYENGYEDPSDHGWPICPDDFTFDYSAYHKELLKAL